jgi:uncharacterized protein YnzC (UPF0291/DUF896 family)
MNGAKLSAIAQDLFLINDLQYKYSFGKNSKLNSELDIYFYRTILEEEKVSLFILDVSGTTIVVPASKEWDETELDGLYKIECIECEGKFIFKEYNHMQTIKSAYVTSIYPINNNDWEIEYRILDKEIRRFDILNQIIKQNDDSLAKKALNIIFNDNAEILAEKVPTINMLTENAKAQLAKLESNTNDINKRCYININKNNVRMELDDKGGSYYVVDLTKLNHCFLYQQYILFFYIQTYFANSTYTEIRLVKYEGKKYLVFINQNDEMIIDLTFVEVIDTIIRDSNGNDVKNIAVKEEVTSNDTEATSNDAIAANLE